MTLAEIQEFSLELREETRNVIRESLGSQLKVRQKPDKSFVTSLDEDIERRLRERIQERFPEHGIIGEEFGKFQVDAKYVWTLDPIDGTEELVHGTVVYGTIIGLLQNNKPVFGLIDHERLEMSVYGGSGIGVFFNGEQVNNLGPVSESRRLYIGTRAQFLRQGDESDFFDKAVRAFPNLRVFCSPYAYTSLILNQADVCLEFNLKIWDLAAAEALVEAVGGKSVRFGEKILADGTDLYGAVFGKKEAVDELCSVLNL